MFGRVYERPPNSLRHFQRLYQRIIFLLRSVLFCLVILYERITLNTSGASGTAVDAAVGIKSSRAHPSDYRRLLKLQCHFQDLFISAVMISPPQRSHNTRLLSPPPPPFCSSLKYCCVCPATLLEERPCVVCAWGGADTAPHRFSIAALYTAVFFFLANRVLCV